LAVPLHQRREIGLDRHWKVKKYGTWFQVLDDLLQALRDSVVVYTVVTACLATQSLHTDLSKTFFIQELSPSLL